MPWKIDSRFGHAVWIVAVAFIFHTFISLLAGSEKPVPWRCGGALSKECLASSWSTPAKPEGAPATPLQVPSLLTAAGGGDLPEEVYARQVWGTAFAFAMLAVFGVAAYAWSLIAANDNKTSGKLGGAALAIALVLSFMNYTYHWVDDPAITSLASSALSLVPAPKFIRIFDPSATAYSMMPGLRVFYNTTSIAAILLIILAALSLAFRTAEEATLDDKVANIAERTRQLERLLYSASVTFVLAAFAFRAFTSWPSSLASPGSLLAKDMALMGNAALVSWSGTMSVMLVTLYITTAFRLDSQVDEVLSGKTELEKLTVRQKFGVSSNLKDHVSKLIAAMLPLVAGSAEAVLSLKSLV